MEIKGFSIQSLGIKLSGRFYLPKGQNSKQSAVILCSGDGVKGSGGSTYRILAEKLYVNGIATVIFDFCGLGKSEGLTTDLNIHVGIQNLKDVYHYVSRQDFIDNQNIGLFGSSFGGNIVLLSYSVVKSCKVIALKSPVTFYPESHETEFTDEEMNNWKVSGYNPANKFSYHFYLSGLDYNTYALAKQFTQPILVTHGTTDEIVPYRQSLRLMECLNPQSLLRTFEREGHGYDLDGNKEKMINLVLDWLVQNLEYDI